MITVGIVLNTAHYPGIIGLVYIDGNIGDLKSVTRALDKAGVEYAWNMKPHRPFLYLDHCESTLLGVQAVKQILRDEGLDVSS